MQGIQSVSDPTYQSISNARQYPSTSPIPDQVPALNEAMDGSRIRQRNDVSFTPEAWANIQEALRATIDNLQAENRSLTYQVVILRIVLTLLFCGGATLYMSILYHCKRSCPVPA